ncbi:hypothetical protein [Pseudoalteromonas pernae]|uniref:hypothetical protein n=1 Tax=Pseudoalteromonas pernae TaxID=3118054 RepID=UPI003241CACF
MRLTLIAIATLALSACNNTEETKADATQYAEPQKVEIGSPKPAPKLTENQQSVRDKKLEMGDIEVTATAESIRAGYKNIHDLTEDKSCDTSEQCKVLAVGSRACGGANEYVVYSTKTTDSAKVEQLAETLTAQEHQYNLTSGMVSICQHLIRPATQCQESQCVKIAGSSTSVY